MTRKKPGARRKVKRPDLIEALEAMEVLDPPLVWDYLPAGRFHSAVKHQSRLAGMRFRTFKDFFKGKLKLFVVRVE